MRQVVSNAGKVCHRTPCLARAVPTAVCPQPLASPPLWLCVPRWRSCPARPAMAIMLLPQRVPPRCARTRARLFFKVAQSQQQRASKAQHRRRRGRHGGGRSSHIAPHEAPETAAPLSFGGRRDPAQLEFYGEVGPTDISQHARSCLPVAPATGPRRLTSAGPPPVSPGRPFAQRPSAVRDARRRAPSQPLAAAFGCPYYLVGLYDDPFQVMTPSPGPSFRSSTRTRTCA